MKITVKIRAKILDATSGEVLRNTCVHDTDIIEITSIAVAGTTHPAVKLELLQKHETYINELACINFNAKLIDQLNDDADAVSDLKGRDWVTHAQLVDIQIVDL